MKKLLALALLLTTSGATLTGFGQDKQKDKKTPAQTPPAAVPSPPKPMTTFGLPEDTPVRLRLNRTISSATEKVNDKVDFTVIEDIKVGDLLVVPQGATAIATVTEAKPKGRMGKAGKLNVNIDYVQLPSGDKVMLQAVKGGKGGSHTGAMTGAMIATGIVFFPAAPLFLFMHGKDITIAKGTEITAYVAADTPLDQTKFTTGKQAENVTAASGGSPQPPVASGATSTVTVKSNPDGAEISVDGKFMGSTQSTLKLAPGEHTMIIEKPGFKPWQRTMTVSSSDNITVDATLDKLP